jgi:hypothetical protein
MVKLLLEGLGLLGAMVVHSKQNLFTSREETSSANWSTHANTTCSPAHAFG